MKTELKSAANIRQAVPFFGVSDIEASVRYYTEGLGFEITSQWRPEGKLRWCMLQRGGAALMLQAFRPDGQHTNMPTDMVGVGVTICFICADALAFYREVRARGIQATRPFVGNGMWVTSLSDPDGYRLDFESYTDVPEETEFVESEH